MVFFFWGGGGGGNNKKKNRKRKEKKINIKKKEVEKQKQQQRWKNKPKFNRIGCYSAPNTCQSNNSFLGFNYKTKNNQGKHQIFRLKLVPHVHYSRLEQHPYGIQLN